MAIETSEEFENKLAQLSRLYRAMRVLWDQVDTTDQAQVAKWVVDAGKVMEVLSQVLGDVEDYSGCMELRLILDQMKTIQEQRASHPQRA